MEGVGDYSFRKAMASVGGFDEAIRDFIRVPRNCHVKSLAAVYNAEELSPIPMAAQIMGGEIDLMCSMAQEMVSRKAAHININCGCPSNTVTGRGAGSSLLKEPVFLHEIVKAIVASVPKTVTVSVKMRSGFNDTALFKENLHAVQESGAHYLIIHPRTKVEGYGPPADWKLIAEAKSTLSIPIVGNGDILNVQDALNMLKMTNCDALMIGRGSVINPFIFHQIRSHFSKDPYTIQWENREQFLNLFLGSMSGDVPIKTQVNKLKQLLGFWFKGSDRLMQRRNDILTFAASEPETLLAYSLAILREEIS